MVVRQVHVLSESRAMDPGFMQMQLRNNAADLESYLKDLQSWENEIKEKDKNLSKQKPILKEELPPIRSKTKPLASSGQRKRKKKKRNGESSRVKETAAGQSRIRSYDYTAWDKFDVDKACEDVDYQVQSPSTSEDSESSDETEEEERKKQQAVMEKEKGNTEFKQGQYESAEESYTKAMELDPLNAVLPANRAMARLKLQRYEAAEKDCSLALALDDSYVKAYFRRATARVKLGELHEAKLDYEAMLRFEPGNKQAKVDLAKLEEKLKEQAIRKGFVFPVKRLPHLRSKKPLKRVHIEDIGEIQDTPVTDGNQLTEGEGDKGTSDKPTSAADRRVGSKSTEVKSSSSSESKTDSMVETRISSTSVSSTHSSQSAKIIEVTTSATDNKLIEDVSTSEKSGPTSTNPPPPPSDGTKMSVLQQTKADSTLDVGVASSPPSVEPQQEVAVPGVPDSSLQFQADWKRLRRDKTSLAKYFKSIPPSKYLIVLQQSLETDIFSEIIAILHRDYVGCGTSCLEELLALTKVNRFSVAVMFLSRKDKESLTSVFRGLLDICDHDSDKATITSLSKDYSINI